MTGRTILLTALAMVCFAANSLLCRIALAPRLIDANSFASVRVLSAALMLLLVVRLRGEPLRLLAAARVRSIMALLVYLLFFTFAYVRLGAGTGALILFGAVQLTMFAVGRWEGEHFAPLSWAGLATAIAGLVYLVLPGIGAPDPQGAAFMAVSGMAWGLFSLFARGVGDPLQANASVFVACLAPVVLLNLYNVADVHYSLPGIALAVASGALASGLGYVIWYMALRGLPATHAATVQLSVPAIAALGGALVLAEPLSGRLLIASAAMLGGIAVVLRQRTAAGRHDRAKSSKPS